MLSVIRAKSMRHVNWECITYGPLFTLTSFKFLPVKNMSCVVNQEYIETVLKKYDTLNSVSRVISVSVGDAAAQGDNYSSNVLRAKVEVLLGSGAKVYKSVIIKRLPTNQKETVKWLMKFGCFKREIEVMDVILPAMESLMKEFNDENEIFWPKLIHYTPYSEIILEDLKVCNYELANRQVGLDFCQSKIIMNHIGKFHAMSVILRDRGQFDPQGHIEHVIPHSDLMIKNYVQGCFKTLSTIILRDWGKDWNDIGKRLEKAIDKIPSYMKEFGELDENRFNVLNHGDLWAPNLLFKYKKGIDSATSFRLIDYQMTFYTTYAFDLNHFLYSSIQHHLRLNHFDTLLKIYHTSLVDTFKFFNHKLEYVPSFDDVLKEMERTSFFGLIAVCMIMSVIMCDPKDSVDFEYLISPKEELMGIDENVFKSEEYIKCLKDCLLKFSSKGVF